MITFEVLSGESLTSASQRIGRSIRMLCGGAGVCGKCRIIARHQERLSPLTTAERDHLSTEEIAAGYRLACQVQFKGPGTVAIPESSLDQPDGFAKEAGLARIDPDPWVRRIVLPSTSLPPASDSLAASWEEAIVCDAKAAGVDALNFRQLRSLQQMSRCQTTDPAITLVIHAEHGITAVLAGQRTRSLGIALDIGTTTMAAYLCDLTSGTMLSSAAAANPQREAGEDVISRIAHCSRHPEGLTRLQTLAVEEIDRLIGRCLDGAGAERDSIDAVSVAGNSTMEQILAGLHPRGIGVFPYLPTTRNFPAITAADIGLSLNPGVPVDFFPLVSGFVGGDTLAALLADGSLECDTDTLLVDIGTNGELVLCHAGRLWATSCATGPAFEGARISCGMRAVPGAIDQVFLDPVKGIGFHVLGGEMRAPLGLCGSGIIDAVAVLLQSGALRTDGRFNPGYPGVVCSGQGAGQRFVLVPAESSGTGMEIAITQRDVRQLQLAKAALATGIVFLMDSTGLRRLPRTVLTGAFGARFNWRSAVAIGMLPAIVAEGVVEPRGNLAGLGAAMALVNQTCGRRVREIQARVEFVEMGADPAFSARFVQAMAFPDPLAACRRGEDGDGGTP